MPTRPRVGQVVDPGAFAGSSRRRGERHVVPCVKGSVEAHLTSLSATHLRRRQATANLSSEPVGDLCAPRYRLRLSGPRVGPERVGSPFAFEHSTVPAEMLEQRGPFQSTVTVSCRASFDTLRSPSCRRPSKTGAIAARRLSLYSSSERPWPLAPGISGHEPIYHPPSRSYTAVNSWCIVPSRTVQGTTTEASSIGKRKRPRGERLMRRGWDSNPRSAFTDYGFQDR